MSASTPLSHKDYTVGWICALPLEMAAAKLMLDTIHPPLPLPPTDQNTYILGNIKEHNIVIACLPSGAYGTTSAATVAMQLLSSFHSIRFGLMVGIGGGVPSSDADIRLGDIVVSEPTGTFGGVIQYDLGKALSGGQFQRTGMLNRPPKVLLTALATLKAHHLTEESQILTFIANIEAKAPRGAANFVRPSHADCLYQVEYEHGGSNDCSGCDRSRLVSRPSRGHDEPVIHYGLIASANQVVKYGRHRDQLAEDLGVYCVEMEAAGLMNDFPCIVIRGICDYADSHKNKDWQGYAAAVAAAYARELLLVVPINHIENTPTAQEALANAAPCFDVPFDLATVPVYQDFLGRQDELEHLWDYLQPANPQSQKVAVLHGLGGIGKTQLAIRFARDHKKDFSAVLWLSGKDEGTLLQSLSSVLPRLPGESCDNEAVNDEEVEKRARKVLKWLSAEGNSRWLIIFDNFDSPIDSEVDDGYDIAQFLPTADHGSILITSRRHGLTELGKSFPVHRLEFKDAIQLLLQSSGLSVDNSTEDIDSNPDYVALADCLDGLPLAIVIAGAFMRETGTSVEEYLQLYRDSWAELQSCSRPTRHYQQGNILETWMITYKEIQEDEPDAAMLLLLLACYNNRDIWFELIQHGLNCTDLPDWFGMAVCSKLAFKTEIKILVGFSLVETNQKEGSYTLHPVVQDWCLYMAESDKHTAQLYELALVSVGSMIPAPDKRDYARLQRRLLPHVNHLLRTKRYWPDKGIDVWKVLANLGNLYQAWGKLEEAEEMYQQALAGFEKVLGRDHASTLDTVNNLGALYWVQGRLKEAEEMYQQVLEDSKILGPDHISTLMAINNLGLLYRDQGKLEEAEKIHQQVLAGYTKVLGPHHPSTIAMVSSLGNLYRYQGKLKEAEDMHQQALAGFKKELGPDHTSVIESINSLGIIYMDQGKLKEAEGMLQQALAGFEKALGLDHISTLHAVNNLGILYWTQGRPKEAEKMLQRALSGYRKALGLDHISTLHVVNNLGLLYWTQGRLKEAEKMFQRALTGYRKALGPEHSSTQKAANCLASVAKAGNTPLTPPNLPAVLAALAVLVALAALALGLNRRHSSVPESPQ